MTLDELQNFGNLFQNNCDEIKNLCEEQHKQLSCLDSQINEIYHVLENCSLNAVQISKISKQLIFLLKTRRQTKEFSFILCSVVDKLNSGKIFDLGAHIKSAISRSNNRQEEYVKISTACLEKMFP
jgi:hypothetical protein